MSKKLRFPLDDAECESSPLTCTHTHTSKCNENQDRPYIVSLCADCKRKLKGNFVPLDDDTDCSFVRCEFFSLIHSMYSTCISVCRFVCIFFFLPSSSSSIRERKFIVQKSMLPKKGQRHESTISLTRKSNKLINCLLCITCCWYWLMHVRFCCIFLYSSLNELPKISVQCSSHATFFFCSFILSFCLFLFIQTKLLELFTARRFNLFAKY